MRWPVGRRGFHRFLDESDRIWRTDPGDCASRTTLWLESQNSLLMLKLMYYAVSRAALHKIFIDLSTTLAHPRIPSQ